MCYNVQVNEIWCHGQAVRQRSATPLSPVRFRVAPPTIKPSPFWTGLYCWSCYARNDPGSARQRRSGSGSHSPPEDRGACSPGAGRANIRAKREIPEHRTPSRCPFLLESPLLHRTGFSCAKRKKTGSHSPPEDRGACSPGAGRANIRRRRNSGNAGGHKPLPYH